MRQDVLTELLASIERREAVAVVTVTAADGAYADRVGRHCLIWRDTERAPVGDLALGDGVRAGVRAGVPADVIAQARDALFVREHRHVEYRDDAGSAKLFIEVQVQPPHLIVVGAGHIAVPLAQIGVINDFEVTVLDDRPQYAHVARFPTADRVIAGDFRTELGKLRAAAKLDHHTYIVLVTRGHQYDVDCLVEVLDDPLAYIGMIGSQRRVRAVFELLEQEQGIPAEKFDRVYAPIGIDIGARTPAEIAVCIMAEIINVMRSGPAQPLSHQIRTERRARRARVAARG